jgi:heme/copper-type cytochrome/quinol oxidase subunit 3
VIDASQLPQQAFGPRAPVWWGNTLFIVIESMSMLILFVSYFYIRQNYDQWPPPAPEQDPPLFRPLPDLGIATANVVLLAATFPLCVWMDIAAKRHNAQLVRLQLVGLLLVGLVSMVLRGYEFLGVHFRWDDNAYGSVVWGLLFMHALYILASIGETGSICLWVWMHEWDAKHAMDVTLTAIYWNWMVVVGLLVYVVVFWSPRVL